MGEMKVTGGIAELKDAELYYEMAGEGAPLVFVHAGITDRRMWDAQFAFFAQNYHVVRYDMRGFGKSPMTGGQFSHRWDLLGLLNFLNIRRAHFIGSSMGGMTVTDFALEHPEMLMSLILVSSALSGFQYQGEPSQEIWEYITARKQGNIERAAELQITIWVAGPRRSAEDVDSKVRRLAYEMGLTALSNQTDWIKETGFVMEEALQPPATGRLDAITVPALSIVGDLDDPSVAEISDLLVRKISGCRSAVIQGTAHLPSMEKQNEFNRIVLEFLHSV